MTTSTTHNRKAWPLNRANLLVLLCVISHRFFQQWSSRRELARLDDYMLRDIGLTRSDLESTINWWHER